MLGNMKVDQALLAEVDRVRTATRVRFRLADDVTVMVSEVACSLPGCPPLETVVAFWTDNGRHQFKIFKPVREVGDADLPYAWLKRALIVPDDYDDGCC